MRQALDRSLTPMPADETFRSLDASFGSWTDRVFDGASYVEGLRCGMARRVAR